jgi:hypothetical protein
MSGHVFHPGHAELHGITVVVETHGGRTYVGRYDSEDEGGVHMLDVGVHEADGDLSKDEYIRRSAKYGVRSQHKHIIVPVDQVARISRLGDLSPS